MAMPSFLLIRFSEFLMEITMAALTSRFICFSNSYRSLMYSQEFMMATDMTAMGTPEEKLKWAFRIYDKDRSGTEKFSEIAYSCMGLQELLS